MLTILIVALCLFLNALFSAFEMAFVTIGQDHFDDLIDKNKKLRSLHLFKKNPERTLSVIQIGITFVGAMAAAVGGVSAVESLEPILLHDYGMTMAWAEIVAVVIVILPLTYFSVVLGELIPKAVALRAPEQVLITISPLIFIIDKFLSPVVTVLERSTDYLLKFTPFCNKMTQAKPPRKVRIENLDDHHQQYVLNLVSLKGIRNRDIFVGWEEVVWADMRDSEEIILEKVTTSRHTRLPVMNNGIVIGLLHTKEFLSLPEDNLMNWQVLIRPILKIHPEDKVLNTFIMMQESHNHMAIVLDEEESPLGIITMENIIEEILGDIHDEDDDFRMDGIIARKKKVGLGSKKFGDIRLSD